MKEHDIQRLAQDQAPTLNRRLLDLRPIVSTLKRSRMTPLQVCEAIIERRVANRETLAFFSGLPADERHYWIASLYTLLMPPARRRRLAAYFTPPHLAEHAIDALVSSGVRLGHHSILDPASGGAAFLVPIAARIAAEGRGKADRPDTIIQSVNRTLRGIEIDAGLANLSRALLRDSLKSEVEASAVKLNIPIACGDTLKTSPPDVLYDAVIGNPPYGRILRPPKSMLEKFKPVISEGYVNLYALFIEQALQWVRPGGVVAYVVPMSFVGGPNFAALRKRILESASVVRLDQIDKRSDVFLDVLYDLCVLVMRRNDDAKAHAKPRCSLLSVGKPSVDLGTIQIPATPSTHVWALPDGHEKTELFQPGLATLSDYGYLTRTGYFVWNREKKRYRTGKKPRAGEVPLVWAHNVRANRLCSPCDGDPDRIGFVKIAKTSSAIVKSDAIVLQRTSNRRQKRRLVGGIVRKKDMPKGFVSENHTILILADPASRQQLPIQLLCRLLNSSSVDARFRRMSGSVSVSTKALRDLPLPTAADVRRLLTSRCDDDEAIEAAYAASTAGAAADDRGHK